MGKIMVVCGESSGDIHAAKVVKKMKEINNDLEIAAMGSEALKKEGAKILIDPLELSSIGFVESLKNLKTHLSHIRLLKDYMRNNRPDVIFLVDYSGFNMMMARIAFKMNIPVVDYFPPTAWIWGKWRAKWMAKYDATIAATFPMERDIYEEVGAKVEFVGHPLVDFVGSDKTKEEIYEEFGLKKEEKIISLMPGSRASEIDHLSDILFATAQKLKNENKEYQFLLPLATGIDKKIILEKLQNYDFNLEIIEDSAYEILKIADLNITASGTATLESLIMETPMLVVYKTGWSTYQLGKRLMKTNYIAMPNIIAKKEVVPEFVQDEAKANNLYKIASQYLNNAQLLKAKTKELAKLKKKLGVKGAVKRVAELVLEEGGLK